ncbi:hypothetical protein ABPG72_007211 [Tetrahymena utriculariae]
MTEFVQLKFKYYNKMEVAKLTAEQIKLKFKCNPIDQTAIAAPPKQQRLFASCFRLKQLVKYISNIKHMHAATVRVVIQKLQNFGKCPITKKQPKEASIPKILINISTQIIYIIDNSKLGHNIINVKPLIIRRASFKQQSKHSYQNMYSKPFQ